MLLPQSYYIVPGHNRIIVPGHSLITVPGHSLITVPVIVLLQMRGDKSYSFSGVTSYGRIWRKGAGKQGVEYASVDIFVEIKSTPSMA